MTLSLSPRLMVGLALLLSAGGCASARSSATANTDSGAPADMSTTPPTPDPRVGLKAGWFDAGQAIWNLTLVSATQPSPQFIDRTNPSNPRLVNSDLAFLGPYVIQGNYSGYQIWNIADPAKVTLRSSYVCPGSQSDVSVYGHLMFVSAEATSGRTDCGTQGVQDTVSGERARGIRIFDITDLTRPKPIKVVQTCRGSHTNTLVTDPNDPANIYIYVSGSSTVRSAAELPGCTGGTVTDDPKTALFRLEVIKVPVQHPEDAAIVSSPRVFADLTYAEHHGESPEDSAAFKALLAKFHITMPPKSGPTQCHDITAYPAIGLAGGACGGYGILLDIRDPAHPKRIGAVADTNFAAWHSVTFNNDGTKVLFSDEWGGGAQPRCRPGDNMKWGADAIYTLNTDRSMTWGSYYKLPAPQTAQENCVAHNGSLIPIPGRDVMVQGWYQGGLSVFDWTDAAHPVEIAYFDRGPMDASKLVLAGYWSAYWYNGYIVGSEIARGLDVFALKPSAFLSQHEIDAAKLVRFDWLNVQGQPQFVWPARFVVARAYVDQLVRDQGLPTERTTAIVAALDAAERTKGAARATALSELSTALDADVAHASDPRRVTALAGVVKAMAADPAHAAG
jgi:hypothetical protein